ncbi:MAG: protein arginine kinase [Gemmatimonadales bacterium]|nr:protein arginine kinase [Gemmatimonadales bacterium]
MIDLSLLPDGGIGWLEASGPVNHLVLSTRIRLARNLAANRFAARMDSRERQLVLDRVLDAAGRTGALGQAVTLRVDTLEDWDRRLLLERHLISRELAGNGDRSRAANARALLVQHEASVMVNEEDHLRLQVLVSGVDFGAGWRRIEAVDTELGQQLAFAFHPEFGYLTSCPTNVGTGLRASVLIHLPGLVLTKEINKTLHGLTKIGLTYRGLYGEGSEVVGNFFQLSNQTTLGKSEPELLDHLGAIVQHVIAVEERARQVLLREAPTVLEDKCWRAFGLLRYARTLGFEETMNLLSGVRLGASLRLIPHLGMYALNRILIVSQPAHLNALAGRVMGDEEMSIRRAEFVRETLEAEVRRGQGT